VWYAFVWLTSTVKALTASILARWRFFVKRLATGGENPQRRKPDEKSRTWRTRPLQWYHSNFVRNKTQKKKNPIRKSQLLANLRYGVRRLGPQESRHRDSGVGTKEQRIARQRTAYELRYAICTHALNGWMVSSGRSGTSSVTVQPVLINDNFLLGTRISVIIILYNLPR